MLQLVLIALFVELLIFYLIPSTQLDPVKAIMGSTKLTFKSRKIPLMTIDTGVLDPVSTHTRTQSMHSQPGGGPGLRGRRREGRRRGEPSGMQMSGREG